MSVCSGREIPPQLIVMWFLPFFPHSKFFVILGNMNTFDFTLTETVVRRDRWSSFHVRPWQWGVLLWTWLPAWSLGSAAAWTETCCTHSRPRSESLAPPSGQSRNHSRRCVMENLLTCSLFKTMYNTWIWFPFQSFLFQKQCTNK